MCEEHSQGGVCGEHSQEGGAHGVEVCGEPSQKGGAQCGWCGEHSQGGGHSVKSLVREGGTVGVDSIVR